MALPAYHPEPEALRLRIKAAAICDATRSGVLWGVKMKEEATLSQILLSEEGPSLRDAMTTRHLADGEVLFRRGDPGDALYVVESGQARVFTLDEAGRELTLNTMNPGEAFGELALLDDRPRSASVAAIGPTILSCLHREDFLSRVHTSPVLTSRVIRLLSERTRHMTEYIELLGRWARLVAEGRYDQAMNSIRERAEAPDRALTAVADAVEGMVQAVRDREERLQKEVAQLRIQIDDAKRQEQVEEITETDYFKSLARQARDLRRQSKE
jgi:CRP-like cAMP-binding protein